MRKAAAIALGALVSGHCASIDSTERVEHDLVQGMVYLAAGPFLLGDNEGRDDERPQTSVQLSSFYVDADPITYRDYEEFIRDGGPRPHYYAYPSYNQPDQPVSGINWNTAACYANWRSVRAGLRPVYRLSGEFDERGYPVLSIEYEGTGFRLPTEAEWERAARGNIERGRFPWGDEFNNEFANYDQAHGFPDQEGRWWRLAPVQSMRPNDSGVRGMAGNVYEWTNDFYAGDHYSRLSPVDPRGPSSGRTRVVRGGSWGSPTPDTLRVARRSYAATGHYNYDIGFRLVISARSVAERIAHGPIASDDRHWLALCRAQNRAEPRNLPIDSDEFLEVLASYLADHYPESIYFHRDIDGQQKLTPTHLAQLIIEAARETLVHPLFLTGIMKSESGMGTVSYPRWFNNPMAYHWANWKMSHGAPRYASTRHYNRRYPDLKSGFIAFGRGLHRPLYYRAARNSFYDFHLIYVGSEAREWMTGVARVYRDVLGIDLSDEDLRDCGRFIYLNWHGLR